MHNYELPSPTSSKISGHKEMPSRASKHMERAGFCADRKSSEKKLKGPINLSTITLTLSISQRLSRLAIYVA